MSRRNGTTRGGALTHEPKGVPQATCAACGQVVNKKQTMRVGDVRVCKGHDWNAKQKALWEAQRRGGYALTLTPESKELIGA
jgi:hypothetical protein